jgi:hypothetical protein
MLRSFINGSFWSFALNAAYPTPPEPTISVFKLCIRTSLKPSSLQCRCKRQPDAVSDMLKLLS